MKKTLRLICLSFLLASVFTASAQEKPMVLSFEEFETWMKELSPFGYPYTETGKNGEEYLATFLNRETLKMIGITMAPLSAFDNHKQFKGAEVYDLKGHQAVFYGLQNFWNLTVALPSLNACLQITTVYLDASKQELEKELEKTGALKK
ncbi:MAG TPA: hypothetical protein P5531_06520 [Bacteroidales bacterium]|nr:hypothetical protein [Bacteroidales bacterium]HSA43709.1 hypothetical protein [Bacteroidales bacterium]